MGKPDLKSVPGDSPHTRCSNCETVFEVSPELLSSADTRVRCGECLSIFDALTNLCSLPPELSVVGGNTASGASNAQPGGHATVDPSGEGIESDDYYGTRAAARPEALIAPAGAPAGAFASASGHENAATDAELGHSDLDATYADFDLFSGDAELPEVAYFEQTSDAPGLELADGESDHDETFSETLFVRDAAIEVEEQAELEVGSDSSFDEIERIEQEESAPREDLVFNYRESDSTSGSDASIRDRNREPNKAVADGAVAAEGFLSSSGAAPARVPASRSPWVFRSLLGLSLTLLLSALFTYRHRDDLHNNASIRPVLLGVCSVIGCSVPSRVAVDQLKLLERSVSSHPDIDDALTIELVFENTADFDQRYPTLVIRLSDTAGRLVARRDFPPVDYVEAWSESDTLDPGERLEVSLEIRDPGANAMSFELDFQPS